MEMKEDIFKLVVGGLLHDVGKMVYRTGKGKYHGELGKDFLRDKLHITDPAILNQVYYHHVSRLKEAKLEKNDLTYITYVADNISAGTDRRMHEEGTEPELKGYRTVYDRGLALQSIFNVLKMNNGNTSSDNNEFAKEYRMMKMITDDDIIHLTEYEKYNYDFYKDIQKSMIQEFQCIQWCPDFTNSIMTILEKYYSNIPSSTFSKQVADVSLYEHSKLTAAFGCCIYEYLQEKTRGETDYQELFIERAKSFYGEKAFLYYTFDISGIQNFIYTIHSDGALKNLRARSFYLEIMVEHIVDEILEHLGLARVNVLYTGGGHAQMILPNTQNVKNELDSISIKVNQWLQKKFDIKLFFAGAYSTCCAQDFMLDGSSSFREKIRKLQDEIQNKKLRRYSAEELEKLNDNTASGDRECKVCHHSGTVSDDGECTICKRLRRVSRDILNPDTCEKESERANKEFFVVMKNNCEESKCLDCEMGYCLPLPGDYNLFFVSIKEFERSYQKSSYTRIYSKNSQRIGCRMETHLWVGEYNRCNTLEETADKANGIRRIAVLRADIDNLSDVFIAGFSDKHNTLSRRTMLSERLSLFFKYYINYILKNGNTKLNEKEEKQRNITVVYSGGDDIFVIGSWDDILGFAVDFHDSLEEYVQKKLTISAGIGIYPEKYPVSQIAYQVGELEECSKRKGKDSVTVFSSDNTFKWDVFIREIYKKKYKTIYGYLENTNDRGISFLYHLLELLQRRKEKISLARYAFLLARLEPSKSEGEDKKKEYQTFASQMYEWIQNDKDAEETIMAIYLYMYIVREEKDNEEKLALES